MHYKTEVTQDWPIGTVDAFVAGKERVRRQDRTVALTAAGLPKDQEIWILRHA